MGILLSNDGNIESIPINTTILLFECVLAIVGISAIKSASKGIRHFWVNTTFIGLLGSLTIIPVYFVAKQFFPFEPDAHASLVSNGLPSKFTPQCPSCLENDRSKWFALMSSSDAYQGKAWAPDFWKEEYRIQKSEAANIFQPNVIWKPAPLKSKYHNVDSSFLRVTKNYPKEGPVERVFTFGGSTMYGTGVPDEHTIASYLSYYLNDNNDSTYYDVTNFGTGAYVLQQDMQRLFDEIRLGNIPDIAIFYNGCNDTYASVFSPGKVNWYHNSQYIEQRLVGESKNFLSSTYDDQYLEDYSKKSKKFLQNYQASIELIRAVCMAYNIDAYFFWQPVLTYPSKPLSEFESAILNNPALIDFGNFDPKTGEYGKKMLNTTYEMLEKTDLRGLNFYNLSTVFQDVPETVYIDFVHLSDKGNMIVANKMSEIIEMAKDTPQPPQ